MILRRREGSGPWKNLRRVVFTYWSTYANYWNEPDRGSGGDLRSAETFEAHESAWKHTGTTYYTYYTQGESNGFVFGLKHVLGPDAVARMVADGQASFGDFPNAYYGAYGENYARSTLRVPATADLAAYADNTFEYDAQRRVSRETVQGGTMAYQYAYTTSSHPEDAANWKTKTTETFPDGTELRGYSNAAGQTLLSVHHTAAGDWNLLWLRDERGVITKQQVDLVLGVVTQRIADVDTANYDQTSFDHDTMGRRNRTESPGGTITSTVFDACGQALESWIGTNDDGATEADPSGGGFEPGNNMVLITGREFDDGQPGGNGLLTGQSEHVDGSTTRVTQYLYDWRGRLTATDGELDFYQQQFYDNLDRAIQVDRRDTNSGGNLVARNETKYDNRGRVYQSITYGVDPATGTVGNALTSNTWYDAAGNTIKSLPAGSKLFTKSVFDSLGRQVAQYQGYDLDETSYADAGTVTGDTILEQSESVYDDASNIIERIARQRYHNAPASQTGQLKNPSTTPKARVTYSALYPDATGRIVATADFGTNAGTVLTRPATIPSRSDTVLVTTTAYNNAGEAFSTTDPAGKESRTLRDAMSRITSQIDNYQASGSGSDVNVTTEFTYTADSLIKTLTAKMSSPATDEVTRYVYGVSPASGSDLTVNNLLLATEYPEDAPSKREEYGYNRQSQRIRKEDQNGTVHSYDFDALGRQTQDRITTVGTDVDSAVRRIEKSYDVRGQVDRRTSLDNATVGSGSVLNETVMRYNDFGQLSTEFIAHSGAVNTSTSPKIQHSYASGSSNQTRQLSVTYPGGRKIDFDYGASGGIDDSLSRVQQLIDGATTLVEYSYLGMGTAVQLSYPQPDVTMDLWDATGGTYAGLDRFGRIVELPWIQDPGGTPSDLARIKYGYNRASSPSYARDEVARSNGAGLDQLYGYDALQRLVDFQQGQLNVGNTAISGSTLTQDWGLDPVGNWAEFNQGVSGVLNQTRTHNRVNEITDISNGSGQPVWIDPAYDDAGNMTLSPRPNGPTDGFALTYDAWNRITKVETTGLSPKLVATYAYDGRNHRITKGVYDAGGALESTIKFFYSDAWQCLEERATPVVGSASTTTYVWGQRYIDDLVCRDDGGGRLYAMQDRQYKTIGLTNTSGTVQERYSYTPYGETFFYNSTFTVRTTSAFDWVYLYTGRRLDPESGLYYFRNRYYDPNLGRFCSKDPIGYEAGSNCLYEYCHSKPYGYVDPWGKQVYLPIPPGKPPTEPHQPTDPLKPGWPAPVNPFPPKPVGPPPPTFGECFLDEYSNCSKSACVGECDLLFYSLTGSCAAGCWWAGPGFGHCMGICELEVTAITFVCKLSCARCKRN